MNVYSQWVAFVFHCNIVLQCKFAISKLLMQWKLLLCTNCKRIYPILHGRRGGGKYAFFCTANSLRIFSCLQFFMTNASYSIVSSNWGKNILSKSQQSNFSHDNMQEGIYYPNILCKFCCPMPKCSHEAHKKLKILVHYVSKYFILKQLKTHDNSDQTEKKTFSSAHTCKNSITG